DQEPESRRTTRRGSDRIGSRTRRLSMRVCSLSAPAGRGSVEKHSQRTVRWYVEGIPGGRSIPVAARSRVECAQRGYRILVCPLPLVAVLWRNTRNAQYVGMWKGYLEAAPYLSRLGSKLSNAECEYRTRKS